MHSIEQKHQFTLLRSQGWSLARIAAHINVPKATIWRWDHEDREILPILKATRFEELQEKYVPTYEEELQQLTAYRDRIRKALGNHDFSTMKPEFLFQMDLQISARLAKFRANLALHSLPETEPVSLPGCLSRTELKYTGLEPEDDAAVSEAANQSGNPTMQSDDVRTSQPGTPPFQNGHVPRSALPARHSENGTFRDETPPGSKRDDSSSATYSRKNGTVPFSRNGAHDRSDSHRSLNSQPSTLNPQLTE